MPLFCPWTTADEIFLYIFKEWCGPSQMNVMKRVTLNQRVDSTGKAIAFFKFAYGISKCILFEVFVGLLGAPREPLGIRFDEEENA